MYSCKSALCTHLANDKELFKPNVRPNCNDFAALQFVAGTILKLPPTPTIREAFCRESEKCSVRKVRADTGGGDNTRFI